jgi:hypothetical protein
MIKDIINPQSNDGMSAFFGLEKQRWDILYQQSVDIFNKHIEESNGTFNKHILVERLVALGKQKMSRRTYYILPGNLLVN